jgi:hypothetical protein
MEVTVKCELCGNVVRSFSDDGPIEKAFVFVDMPHRTLSCVVCSYSYLNQFAFSSWEQEETYLPIYLAIKSKKLLRWK